jgi:hypothetical protein
MERKGGECVLNKIEFVIPALSAREFNLLGSSQTSGST